jgi:MSHA type pilus biogenesis protein MshL
MKRFMDIGYLLTYWAAILSLTGCAAVHSLKKTQEQVDVRNIEEKKGATSPPKQQEPYIRQNITEMKAADPRPAEPKTPDFMPVSEDISPTRVKHVTITARNTPLGDVLHVIAEASGLNLMINQGVLLDLPVTLTLRDVTCENALAAIFSTLDYSYTIRDNMLVVEAITTKIFELGHPALIQSYNLDIGGDILGGASKDSKTIKGSVGQTAKNDAKAFDFWESLEKSLNDMIKKGSTTSAGSTAVQSPPSVVQAGGEVSAAGADRASADAARAAAFAAPAPEQNITVNRLTGTIVVTATRRNLLMIEDYLHTVKQVLNRQVMVEARIIEVQLTDSLKYGIDWSFLRTVGKFGTLASGFGSALNLPDQLFTEATRAAANPDSGPSMYRLGLDRSDFQTLLTALKEQGDVKTLSNPRINVMNGQSALLTVGRSTSYLSKITSTPGGTAQVGNTTYQVITVSTETSSVLSGMLLGIVPYINSMGEITLTVTPIISDLVNLEDKSFGTGNYQATITIPTVDLREMSTTVKLRNGEMVVIGGLISKKETNSAEKIPLLGDIPGLGNYLFTRKIKQDYRSELVVVLQPFLVPTYEQADKLQ